MILMMKILTMMISMMIGLMIMSLGIILMVYVFHHDVMVNMKIFVDGWNWAIFISMSVTIRAILTQN